MPKRKNREQSIQIALSLYIRIQYPDVIFTSESSGVRVSIGAAVRMKAQRSAGKLPDFIMLEPRMDYHGLILELKSEGSGLYLKDGSLSKDKHVQEQNKMLQRLAAKGYVAVFAQGFDIAKIIVDNYMKL